MVVSFLNKRQLYGYSTCNFSTSFRNAGSFSSDYKLNLDGLISRFVCRQEDVFITHGQQAALPPFCCKFRKDKESNLLGVANEDGDILLIDTNRSKGLIKSFVAHHNAIFDFCWLPSKNHLVTGSGDHQSRLFDMNKCKLVSSYAGHNASIKSVDAVDESQSWSIFAAGSRDGNISVWDIREKSGATYTKPSILINCAHSRKHIYTALDNRKTLLPHHYSLSSVSAVAFKDIHTLASAGAADGIIKIWDLRKTYINKSDPRPCYQIKYCDAKDTGHGCTSLAFNSTYKKLYACSTANTIYQLDCHSYSDLLMTYTGFKCNTYFVKLALSCDDEYLLCGSSDKKAYIWKTSQPGLPILELPGHSAEVTAVTWSPYDVTKLVTSGDDSKVLVWKTDTTSDDVTNKYNSVLNSSSCPYSGGDEDLPCSYSNDTIYFSRSATPPNTKRIKNLTRSKKTPDSRPITNFFSPLTTSASPGPSNKIYSKNDESPLQNHTSLSVPITPTVSPQPRSPCKALNENDVVTIASETTSPSKLLGKENSTASTSGAGDKIKPNGQQKRKAESVARSCKYHPDGCGRTRGHTRCGKRIIITPAKVNLKNYFSVSPGE